MTNIIKFPTRAPPPPPKPRPPDWQHQVFIRQGSGDTWAIEETHESSAGWSWVADADSFDAALRMALAHVEPDGVIDLMTGEC